MTSAGPSVVWLCGAPGAGKSMAAWALVELLTGDGQRVAYADIDQLGMLYPAADDDPQRHRFKAEALRKLLPGHALAGAQMVVVSGVIDPARGPSSTLTSDVDLTLCLLTPDPAGLRERILARGCGPDAADEAAAEDALLREALFVDIAIETSDLTIAATAERLRALVRPAGPSTTPPRRMASSPGTTGVVVITGPRASGTSTVAFGLATDRWRAGLRTGFVDLQQIGFIAGGAHTDLAEPALAIHQLAAMHSLMAARGAELLVVSGHLDARTHDALRDALPSAPVDVVRLRADKATIEAHVRGRARGSEARLAGDDLLGASSAHQADVVATALSQQELLDAAAAEDLVLDVGGRSPADVVSDVERFLAGSRR